MCYSKKPREFGQNEPSFPASCPAAPGIPIPESSLERENRLRKEGHARLVQVLPYGDTLPANEQVASLLEILKEYYFYFKGRSPGLTEGTAEKAKEMLKL